MARIRGAIGSIVSGIQTILGSLAQFFRLGQQGSVQAPEAPVPGRTRLETVPEIISELAARRELPSAAEGARVSRSYICYWIDDETGEEYGPARIQVETAEGVAAIEASTEARRLARLQIPRCVNAVRLGQGHLRLQCRQVSSTIHIPTSI